MEVHLQLFSILRECLPAEARGRPATVAVPDGATVGDLIVQLGIDRRLGVDAANGLTRAGWQITVGGRFEPDSGRVLSEGDEVCIFPPVAGG